MDDTSSQLSPDEMALLLRLSRRNLLMYFLTERERLLAEVILSRSFGASPPRAEALIPELRFFYDLTRIDDTDASKTLKLMIAKGIVQRKSLGRDVRGRELKAYRFRPMASWWMDAPRRVDVERALAAEEELDRIEELGRDVEPSGQQRFFKTADDDFDDGLSAASREAALRADAASGTSDVGPDDAHQRDAARQARDAQSEVPAAFIADGKLSASDHRTLGAAGTNGAGSGSQAPGFDVSLLKAALEVSGDAKIMSPAAPGVGGREREAMGESPIGRQMGDPPIYPQMGGSPIELNPAGTRAPACNVTKRSTHNVEQNVQNVSGAAKGGTGRFADGQRNDLFARLERLCDGKVFRQYRGWWIANVRDLPPELINAALVDCESYLARNKCTTSPSALVWNRINELAADMGIRSKRLKARAA